jgi:dTDP-4-dehydrorhamnose 3,5-epimerase
MKVTDTNLQGVKLITPPTIFEDFRGTYIETYNKTIYNDHGVDIDFVQDDISTSTKHVLRGIHGDASTWKLVSCHFGKFYLVVINNDPDSKQFRQWQGFTLSDKNNLQVLIPPKFGNGHVVLSDVAIFHYKQNTEYCREGQFTLRWDDPMLGIWWPIKRPILSLRDECVE